MSAARTLEKNLRSPTSPYFSAAVLAQTAAFFVHSHPS